MLVPVYILLLLLANSWLVNITVLKLHTTFKTLGLDVVWPLGKLVQKQQQSLMANIRKASWSLLDQSYSSKQETPVQKTNSSQLAVSLVACSGYGAERTLWPEGQGRAGMLRHIHYNLSLLCSHSHNILQPVRISTAFVAMASGGGVNVMGCFYSIKTQFPFNLLLLCISLAFIKLGRQKWISYRVPFLMLNTTIHHIAQVLLDSKFVWILAFGEGSVVKLLSHDAKGNKQPGA